jgi:hypothetical protein
MSIIAALNLLREMRHPEQWGHAVPADLARCARAVEEKLSYSHRRIYLAGPMSGMANYNIPAFERYAHQLRQLGHDVFSPHENGLESQAPWAAHMRVDIAALTLCGRFALLPGWTDSKGARIEHDIACALNMQVRPVEHYLQQSND